MSKKITAKLIAQLTEGLRTDVTHWEDFVTLEQRITEMFGVVNRKRSSDDRNVKDELIRVEEQRRWMLNRTRYLELVYDTDDGVSLYLGDIDSDSEDVDRLFFVPSLKPETLKIKKSRKPRVPKGLLTPEQFESDLYAQLSVNDRDVVKHDQIEFITTVLDRMLGEPCGQIGDGNGSGTREWYVGNAELVLGWSKKGMTLKLKDTSAPEPEKDTK